MIKHIVLWTFKEQAQDKIDDAAKMLISLNGKVPQLLSIEVGRSIFSNGTNYQLGIVTTFNSVEDLEAYRIHPEHMKVVKFLENIVDKRANIDFETDVS
ncbi:MAG: Dabb family protein [Clostridiales bacterium]|nr:Dabb family protein [Clostridiales bacterium]